MRKNKHLAAIIAAAGAVAMLSGTSAFAESRHSEETRRRGDARETVRRERASAPQTSNESRNEARTYQRRSSGGDSGSTYQRRSSGGDNGATYERRNGAASTDSGSTWRGDSSSRGEQRRDTYRESSTYRRDANRESTRNNDRGSRGGTYNRGGSSSRGGTYNRGGGYDNNRGGYNNNRGGYNNNRGGYNNNRGYNGNRGQAFHHSGRISNYTRYGNGYRVWIVGAPYPYFVPLAYWNPGRFRIGLSINLGGYWNPGGYYDYYDGYYNDGYAYRGDSRGDLRGTVESVDYRRDTFVIRNEASGSFVTVISRDRRMRDLRPGDFVEMTGTWTRSGYFNAYDVDLLDDGYRDRY